MGSERVYEIAHYRIFDAVADEQDGELPEKFNDEARSPTVLEVGAAKFAARQNQFTSILIIYFYSPFHILLPPPPPPKKKITHLRQWVLLSS